MDAIDCLKNRRAVREYRDEKISEEILKDIIDCARLAPSGNNIQPWEFIVVTNKETLRRIAESTDHGFFIKDSAACVVVFCKDTKYYLEDGCIASENILLAAKAHGVGGCWVAGDKKEYCDKIRKILDVPEGFKLISLLPLGYAVRKVEPHGKRSLDSVLHWEGF